MKTKIRFLKDCDGAYGRVYKKGEIVTPDTVNEVYAEICTGHGVWEAYMIGGEVELIQVPDTKDKLAEAIAENARLVAEVAALKKAYDALQGNLFGKIARIHELEMQIMTGGGEE